jgi:hypothetical protein
VSRVLFGDTRSALRFLRVRRVSGWSMAPALLRQLARPRIQPRSHLFYIAIPVAARRAQGLTTEGFAADEFAGLWRRLFATRCQSAWPQFALAAHYVHYVNRLTFPPIEYAARRFHYLTVATAA